MIKELIYLLVPIELEFRDRKERKEMLNLALKDLRDNIIGGGPVGQSGYEQKGRITEIKKGKKDE